MSRAKLAWLLSTSLLVGIAVAGDYHVKADDAAEITEDEKKTFFHGFFPPNQGCSTTLIKFKDGSDGVLTAAHCKPEDASEALAKLSLDHQEGNRVDAKCTQHPKWKFGEACTGDPERSPPDIMVCKFDKKPAYPKGANAACVSSEPPKKGDKITIVGAGGQPGKRPPDFFKGTTEVIERKGFELQTTPVTEPGDSGGFVGKKGADGNFNVLGVTSGGGNVISCFTDVNEPTISEFLKGQGVAFCGDSGGGGGGSGNSKLPNPKPPLKNDDDKKGKGNDKKGTDDDVEFSNLRSWQSSEEDAVPHARDVKIKLPPFEEQPSH